VLLVVSMLVASLSMGLMTSTPGYELHKCTSISAHAVSCEMRPKVLHLVTLVEPDGDVTLISGVVP